MNQVIITIRFAHVPQCQMQDSYHCAIMAVRKVCIAAPFKQFFEVFRKTCMYYICKTNV